MLSGLNKALRRSISLRIAALFCVTFSVAIAVAFSLTYLRFEFSLEQSDRELLIAKHREAATLLSSGGIKGLREFFSTEKNLLLYAPYMYRVVTREGHTLYLKPSVQEKHFDFGTAFKKHHNPEELLGWRTVPAVNDEDQYDLYTEKVGSDFYLEVGTSSEDRQDVLDQMMSIFIAIGLAFVLISGGLGWLYARRVLKPIRTLLATIANIEKGRLGERVMVDDSSDELNELGKTFNRMIARIERLIAIMKESLDNVAHDIRTPLTRIKVVAEDALISAKPEALQEALADCAENVTVISDMVNQLMSISEAESGTLALGYEIIDVKKMLHEVIEIYDFIAQEKSIEVICTSIDPGLTWSLDSRRIKQVIANLLDNALKFSEPHKRVQISAIVVESQLQIAVKDQGPGIPPADIERIWDRLFRGDKSRSARGSGLGLAIARAVVEAHGGTIDVVSRISEGTTFTLRLPESRIIL